MIWHGEIYGKYKRELLEKLLPLVCYLLSPKNHQMSSSQVWNLLFIFCFWSTQESLWVEYLFPLYWVLATFMSQLVSESAQSLAQIWVSICSTFRSRTGDRFWWLSLPPWELEPPSPWLSSAQFWPLSSFPHPWILPYHLARYLLLTAPRTPTTGMAAHHMLVLPQLWHLPHSSLHEVLYGILGWLFPGQHAGDRSWPRILMNSSSTRSRASQRYQLDFYLCKERTSTWGYGDLLPGHTSKHGNTFSFLIKFHL